jgi:hypothetical protein
MSTEDTTPAEVGSNDQLGQLDVRELLMARSYLTLPQRQKVVDEVARLRAEIERRSRGECICIRCGLRQLGKLSEQDTSDDPPFMF